MFHKTLKVNLQIHLKLLANNIVKSKVLYFHNYKRFSFQNHSNPLGLTNTHFQYLKKDCDFIHVDFHFSLHFKIVSFFS